VITLFNGEVSLVPPGGLGSIHWRCVQREGWLGFPHIVSVFCLSYCPPERIEDVLVCRFGELKVWERIALRPKPDGGFLLMMTEGEGLRPVGTTLDMGVTRLLKLDTNPEAKRALVVKFTKVMRMGLS
jgi:hypothetical protein